MRTLPSALLAALLVLLPLAASAGALERIKSRGAIDVAYAVEARPFSLKGEDGQPTGYSVEICRRIITALEQQLGLEELRTRWHPGNTPERLDMVASGKAELECGTSTVTLARQEQVDFSNEIFVESGGILVLEKSDINGIEDLGGKRIAVVPGTTTEQRLARALRQRLLSAELVEIASAKEGIEALDAGKADAYAGDRLVLVGQVTETDDPGRYAMLASHFSIDPYAFALPRGDADFRLAVNRALARVYREGAIEGIFRRWFGAEAKPTAILQAVYLINAYPD